MSEYITHQVLARKYRPQNFSQVIGQDHIVKVLTNAIKNKKVSHAYIFNGVRGVGKTTIARIFAKSLMCENKQGDFEPCNQCSQCDSVNDQSSLSYTEVDGASNNSVDNIRELTSSLGFASFDSSYKIIVIDEVHMLSISAFNALLKTLEEPPENVVFILATTEIGKIPDTILSRCQKLDFKELNYTELKRMILSVADFENIKFENNEIVDLMIEHALGSGRDALSLFELLAMYSDTNEITYRDFTQTTGILSRENTMVFLEDLLSSNHESVRSFLEEEREFSLDYSSLCHSLLKIVYKRLIESLGNADPDLMFVYEILAKNHDWIKSSNEMELNYKFLFLKIVLRKQFKSKQVADETSVNPEPTHKVEKKKEINFRDLVSYTYNYNKTLGANLERGNWGDKPVFHTGNEVLLNIAFEEREVIFYDYLNEKKNDLKEVVERYICENWGTGTAKIKITLLQEQKDFQNLIQIQNDEKKAILENKKQKIIDNKFTKQVIDVFELNPNNIHIKPRE